MPVWNSASTSAVRKTTYTTDALANHSARG